MLFIKGIYLLLSHLPTSHTIGGCLTPSSAIIIIGLRQRRNTPPSGETAEERFNMLARGWFAYPVTPMHAHLPPKSGCINVIPRFALSRRRATALFRNPVRKAQRSVPGFSSTPTSACRRYATSPPSAVAITHRIAPTAQCIAFAKKPSSHRFASPRDALRHTQRAEPPFPGSPALRLNQLLFSYSITFCALPSTTTT